MAILLLVLLGMLLPARARAALPASEQWREAILSEAVGFVTTGSGITGGAGGTLCTVSNLNNAGAGSLRDCVDNAPSPTWIVFSVSGTIALESTLRIRSNTTIDGRGADITLTTSPAFNPIPAAWGNGIDPTLVQIGHYNDGLLATVSNILIENLKFIGCGTSTVECNAQLHISDAATNIWIDHNTFQDAIDEKVYIGESGKPGAPYNPPVRVTVSRNRILPDTGWPYNGHGLITENSGNTDVTLTLARNLLSSQIRAPQLSGSRVHSINDMIYTTGTARVNYGAQAYYDNPIFERDVADSYPMINGGVDPGCVCDGTCQCLPALSLTVVGAYLLQAFYVEYSPELNFTPSTYYSYSAATANDALRTAILAEAGWQDVSPPAGNPVVTITAPNGGGNTVVQQATLTTLAGTASDDGSISTVAVACVPSCGAPTVTGTTTWSVASLTLQPGLNTITVTATDNAANTAEDTITITYVALLAHYLLNSDAADATGLGHTGTLVGSPTFTTGRIDQSLSLNGTTQSVTVADANDLDLTGPYTLAAWVYSTSTLTTFASVLSKDAYYLYAGAETCGAGSVIGGDTATGTACDPTPLEANVWTHLAVTFDGTAVTLYRNGTQVATTPAVGGPVVTTTPVTLGTSPYNEYFPGRLDDVRIYAGALDAAAVNLLAHPLDPYLVAYYALDGNASDVTGNHPGTLVGSPSFTTGRIGQALVLNGTTQWVSVPDATALDLTWPYSLTAWVWPQATLTDFASVLVKNYTYYLYAGSSAICGAGGVMGGHEPSAQVCHGTQLTAQTWTHLAVTFDGTTLRLYRGGSEVATLGSATAATATTGTLQIGASQFGEGFAGRLDEVRLYSGVLDATTIAALATPPATVNVAAPLRLRLVGP